MAQSANMQQARDIVKNSTGLQQTRALAQEYVDKAIEAISAFPESEAKTGLVEMCTKVMKRRK
jgi:hexaprenyl-diphosphate synthase